MTHSDDRSYYIQYLSDAHKDIHGFRPRGSWWDAYWDLDLEGLKAAAKKFSDQIEEILEEEKAQAEYERQCEIGHSIYSLLKEETQYV